MVNRVLTRTKGTEEKYSAYARSKERKIREHFAYRDDEASSGAASITPMQVFLWLSHQVAIQAVSKATLRFAKAAFVHELAKLNTQEANEAIVNIKSIAHSGYKRDAVGPAKKLKKLSREDEDKLISAMIGRGGKWAGFAANWIKFTRMIGMRPCEFERMKLVVIMNGDYAIEIINAKNTNGRSHGVMRTVPLPNISDADLNALRAFLQDRDRFLEMYDYKRIYQMIKSTIYYNSKKCFARRKQVPSLYTMRHQFNANMKASGLSVEEVAALDGHVNKDTAGFHYARASSGEPVPGVYAIKEEVDRVTKGKGNTRGQYNENKYKSKENRDSGN